jgi:hypothetical protein
VQQTKVLVNCGLGNSISGTNPQRREAKETRQRLSSILPDLCENIRQGKRRIKENGGWRMIVIVDSALHPAYLSLETEVFL